MRKFTILILSVCLITGAVTMATAASLDLGFDNHSEVTLRGSVAPFFVETPFAQKDWNQGGTKTWGIAGLNVGVKGPGATPFYGLMQLNTVRQIPTNTYDIETIELGPGVQFSVLENVGAYAELTVSNLNFKNFNNIKPSFELGVSANFALFPAPKEVG